MTGAVDFVPEKYEEITVLGKYRNVWLVLDRETKKVYVKKLLDIFELSVYQRIQALADPHLVRVLGCRLTGDGLWVLEEYVPGDTLEERMERSGLFSEGETIRIIQQVCEGLNCLHRQPNPIIHRDIKLSNVMITGDGTVKLIDYNGAREFEKGKKQDTRLIGTPGYAAPEQFGFGQTDIRTDIYAVGVLMNRMLTNKHVSEQVWEGPLGPVIRRCTSLDPDKRYQTAEELRQVLMAMDDTAAEEAPQPEKGWKQFWPIPGFRSGKLWKMVTAVLGYGLIFRLSLDVGSEVNQNQPFYLALEHIFVGMYFLFLVALACDYKGIRGRFPLMRRKEFWLRIVGFVIYAFLGLMVATAFTPILKIILGG